MQRQPTRTEIERARHTRAQLAEWGIPWPPPKGWRKRLLRAADRRDGTKTAKANGVRTGPYRVGGRHRCWPEWTWDGEAFVPTNPMQGAHE
jgi:hypothetical protein